MNDTINMYDLVDILFYAGNLIMITKSVVIIKTFSECFCYTMYIYILYSMLHICYVIRSYPFSLLLFLLPALGAMEEPRR